MSSNNGSLTPNLSSIATQQRLQTPAQSERVTGLRPVAVTADDPVASPPHISPLYVPTRPPDPLKMSPGSSLSIPVTASMERSLSTAERWGLTLDRVVKGIVSIRLTIVRNFERSSAGQGSATGFVVDRTKGIILSNRHVVNPGPITATALFNRYEEIPIEPLYADPVHDFGFFKFDPSQLKFAELEEIELYPEGARVGLDIKVCGNDGGEQLSVLSGMLARLDRASPHDNDFNTFYFQAASGSSTGSSGSPVLDVQGRAVALCAAGSTNSASSFYLPLDKVQRALRLIQQGKPVPRGTLQIDFHHVSYDRLRKTGLPEAIEKDSRERHVEGTGLLIVSGVVPEGPGSLAGLQVGDILLKLEHPAYGERYVNNFYSLWDVLDEVVDDTIKLTVCRGVDLRTMEATVQDLYSIIPNEFLEVGAGIVHPLSYQVARFNNIPCRGLIVPEGGMFSWLNTNTPFILMQFDDKDVSTLDELIPILLSVPDKKKVKYKFRVFGSWQENIALFDMDHHFFGMTLFKRRQNSWERHRFQPICNVPFEVAGTFDVERELTWSEELRRNLVWVNCRLPFSVEGFGSRGSYAGLGVLVIVSPTPFIVVSRDIIPVSVCELFITICNRRLPGSLVYLGLVAVVTVNKDLLHSGLTAPKFSNKVLKIGDEIEDFALDISLQLLLKTTRIKDMGSIGSSTTVPPRYRTKNIEGIFLMDFVASQGGLYLDPEDKSVVALSMSLNFQGNRGVDYNFYIRPIIEALERGEPIKRRSTGWNFFQSNLSECLEMGLRQERAIRMVQLARAQNALPRPVSVCGPLRPPTCHGLDNLQVGDILIEINGAPVIRVTDLHVLTQVESAEVLVSRKGEEVLVNLQTHELPSEWTEKILFWAGGVFHRTHDAVLEQISPEFAAVSKVEDFTDPANALYMGSYFYGSPGSGIPNTEWILEVNGEKVRSLEDMLKVVEKLKGKDGEYVRVKTLHRFGTTDISTIRLDSKFWPAATLEHKDGKWVRTELE